jgi:hypothetical protein
VGSPTYRFMQQDHSYSKLMYTSSQFVVSQRLKLTLFFVFCFSMASNVPEQSSQSLENTNFMHQCYDNYVIVDIGANLTNKKFSRDLDSVIQRAKDSGKFSIEINHICIYYVFLIVFIIM